MYHVNTNDKKAGVAVVISERADFRARRVIRNKERHYIMLKGPVLWGIITFFNMYVPINRASKYIRG